MQQDVLQKIIGGNIREGRRRLGLTQVQFAESVALSCQSLSALETGTQFSRMETYCRIAESLALPLHMLFLIPKLQDYDLDEQYRLLLCECDADEKRAILNIVREITKLIR
jgi:DNA-binding XRE family transcriptional regulator